MRIALLGNPDSLHVRRWIAFLRSRGHELLLVADPYTRSRPDGVRIAVPRWTLPLNVAAFRLTPRPYGNALWKPCLYRPLIADFRPDVVHGFEVYNNGLATAWSGPWPKVLSPWGKDVFIDANRNRFSGWMIRHALRRADRITCNDESIGPYLHERFGVPSERIRPFSWGVDLATFTPRRGDGPNALRHEPEGSSVLRELDLPPAAPLLFSPRKWGALWGADRVAGALPAVLSEVPDLHVILMGPLPSDPAARALQSRLNAEPFASRLHWIEPAQPSDTMARLFQLAGAFVSAAPCDLLSQTILEGMAVGCFPVLSDLPAYAKYARNGETALLVRGDSPGDWSRALIRALRDEPLRHRAADINIARMRREEDASRNMLRIETVYEESIAAFRSRR
jgi:L-malate glycosyltransferase